MNAHPTRHSSNRQILLKRRPKGKPQLDDFEIVETPIPDAGDGQLLLENLYLSVEPYMLLGMQGPSRSGRDPGGSRLQRLSRRYLDGVDLDAVMYGPTVSRVLQSHHPDFVPGDLVSSYAGWQQYALDDGTTLRKLDPAGPPPSYAIGALGIPGLTAYAGLRAIGKPKAGETLVVSAAMGPVGSTVGQIARIDGARAIGIASGASKCAFLVESLGFDAAIDRLSPSFEADLAAACPDGVDVYFENAGGEVGWAVFKLLNEFARVPLCGLVAGYGGADHSASDRSGRMMHRMLHKRILMQGLFTFDHADMEEAFLADMTGWIASGALRVQEDIVDGVGAAPAALIDVLAGRNFGKKIVRIAHEGSV